MPFQLSKGHTYNPGDVVDAPDLNSLVDSAIALKGFIHSQISLSTAADPVNDEVIIWDASVDDLRRAKLQALPSGVTSVSVIVDSGPSVLNFSVLHATTTPEFHIGLDNQAAGKFLAGPISGPNTTPGFRPLSPSDLPSATLDVAVATIDWSLGNCFTKTLTTDTTFIFNNPSNGQTIRVRVIQDTTNRVVHWPNSCRWPNGTDPVMTTGAGNTDIYTFTYISNAPGGFFYGTFAQKFLP